MASHTNILWILTKKETILQIDKAYYLTDLIRSFHKIVHFFCMRHLHDPVRHQKLTLKTGDFKRNIQLFFFQSITTFTGVSRAGGVREVEHDGRVCGLKADCTGRGVDECRVPVCHDAVT